MTTDDTTVERKIVRLDKLASFVNANFERDFVIPFAIEIERQTNKKKFGTRFAVNLCMPETMYDPVKTVCYSKMIASSFIGDRFDKIESSIAGMGPGIEILGSVAWYWMISGNNLSSDRDTCLLVANKAWDAWTLATAMIDGSKARDRFQRDDFICPGVTLNQGVLCETHQDTSDPSKTVWLKRATGKSRHGELDIQSRWTFLKTYIGSNGNFSHEEKHTVMDTTPQNQVPVPFEEISKARKNPFNP